MRVVVLDAVQKFVDGLEVEIRADAYHLIELLEVYGHGLSMPMAKPLGKGLYELRVTGNVHVRLLYGFCENTAVIVHVVKKKQSALRTADAALARKRLEAYCA